MASDQEDRVYGVSKEGDFMRQAFASSQHAAPSAVTMPQTTTAAMRRKYMAECIGTFGIVFAPCAAAASAHAHGGGSLTLLNAALVSGLIVLAMIYTLGHISAAHFNPAVTLGFAVARRFPWRYVLPYWGAQIAGSIVACLLLTVLFGGSGGPVAGYGAHIPVGSAWRALGMEVVLTFFLMIVISAVATDKRVNGAVPGLAIGLTVVMCILAGGPISGGSMNPARSLGPALFARGEALSHIWVYLIGPAAGAALAAYLYEMVRGGEHHAQGAPNDLAWALADIEAHAVATT